MLETISLTEARKQFLSIVSDVAAGTRTVLLTKHGRPAAVVVGATEFFQMRETLDLLLQSKDVALLAKGLEGFPPTSGERDSS